MVLDGVRVGIGGEEYWILLEDGSNSYSIKSTYKVLLGSRFDSSEVDIFKTLWEIKIPLKVSFMLWRKFLDRIPTKVNLHRRQIQIHE